MGDNTAETRPYFAFYAKDFTSSTAHLSPAACGAHVRLQAHAWPNCGCPLEPEALRRIAGADRSEWRRIWRELEPLWPALDRRRLNPALEQVRASSALWTATQKELGRIGGLRSASARHAKYGSSAPRRSEAASKPLHEGLHEAASRSGDEANTKLSVAVAVSTTDDDYSEHLPGPSVGAAAASSSSSSSSSSLERLVELWRSHGPTGESVAFDDLRPPELDSLRDALSRRSLSQWESTFARVSRSDYLAGRADLPAMSLWRVLDKATRIDAGDYDNRVKPAAPEPPARVRPQDVVMTAEEVAEIREGQRRTAEAEAARIARGEPSVFDKLRAIGRQSRTAHSATPPTAPAPAVAGPPAPQAASPTDVPRARVS